MKAKQGMDEMVCVLFTYIADSSGGLKIYKVWGVGYNKIIRDPPPKNYLCSEYTYAKLLLEQEIGSVD